MPDNLVPIVRRPVRRTSTTLDTKADLVGGVRKLSIGGDSNSRRSPEQQSPPRIKKTWSPPKKAVSPKVETRPVLRRDEELPPPPAEPTYAVPSSTSGFPHADKHNLPKLPIARDRVKKTQVSLLNFILSFFLIHLLYMINFYNFFKFSIAEVNDDFKSCDCNRVESGPLS